MACAASSSTYSPSVGSAASSTLSRTPESGLYCGSLSNLHPTKNRDAFKDVRELLDALHTHEIPGPLLLRMQSEFSKRIGHGAQSFVHVPGKDYDKHLATFPELKQLQPHDRLVVSAKIWRGCAVKQLRFDRKRGLDSQLQSALNEARCLCKYELRKSDSIVKLLGWGLCLDSLERPQLSHSRLPLLIFERAERDLGIFIQSHSTYKLLEFDHLRGLALDIGRGLQAIHASHICHGDVKLDNVLVFRPRTTDKVDPSVLVDRPFSRWHAKLCDFGSTPDARWVPSERYLGTNGWKAPEALQSQSSIDSQLCDIFAYGLIVWALFLGISRSPIEEVSPDDLISYLGDQCTYRRARGAILDRYAPGRAHSADKTPTVFERLGVRILAVILLLRQCMGLSDSPSTTIQHAERQDAETGVTSSSGPVVLEKNHGPQANRLLSVLAEALNDCPSQRSKRPWDVFRQSWILQNARTLAKFKPRLSKQTEAISGDSAPNFFSTYLHSSAESSRNIFRVVIFTVRITWRSADRLWLYLKVHIPLLQPGSSRQRIFCEFHYVFADILGNDPNSIAVVSHSAEVACFELSIGAKRRLVQAMRKYRDHPGTYLTHLHVDYALARLRSRFLPCCWDHMFCPHSSSLDDEFPDVSMQIHSDLHRIEYDAMGMIAAWAFRPKKDDDVSSVKNDELCRFLCGSYAPCPDNELTDRLLALMDCNFFLGQPVLFEAPTLYM